MIPPAAATGTHQSRTYRVPIPSVTTTYSAAVLTQEQAGGPSDSHVAAPPSLGAPYHGLSDEVLEQILEELHSAYQDDFIGVPPLGYLTISKRLYNIARPVWLSAISTQDDAANSDRLIAKLMTDAPLRPLVRQLELKLYGAFSQSQITILTLLDNLRILEVSFDKSWPKGSGGAKTLPATLLDAIASRPHLEKVGFSQLVEGKHPVPEPVNQRPLQVFTAPIHSIKNSLQQYLTARRVQMLELTVFLDHDEPFIGNLPWEDLSSVVFGIGTLKTSSAITCDVPEALGRQLRARSNPDARLLHVGLSFDSKAPYFGWVLRAFLDAFAPRQTRFTVQAEGSSVSLAVNGDQEPCNLVEAFQLDAPYALTEGRNLADLAAFLDNMPAVTDVSLRQVKLIASNKGPRTPVPVPVSALEDERLGIEYPHFFGLLSHIARSKITRFEITSPSEPRPVRWARETAKDPLVRVESRL